MKENTIEIKIQVNEDGTCGSVSVQSNASTCDRILAAMYLLEDAFKAGQSRATDEEQNPIATFVGDSFNAYNVLSSMSKEVTRND